MTDGVLYLFAACLWGILPRFLKTYFDVGYWSLLSWCLLGSTLLVAARIALDLDRFHRDTFWSLSAQGRLGLLLITGAIALLGCWLAARGAGAFAARGHRRAVRAGYLVLNLLVLASAYAVVWLLVPQIYYEFYRLLMPGLPAQWVLQDVGRIAELATSVRLAEGSTLAMLTTGGLFWTLVALTIAVHASRGPRVAESAE